MDLARPFRRNISSKLLLTPKRVSYRNHHPRRWASQSTEQSRFDRVNSRLPRFLQKYTIPLRNAPITHISAFLLLHEITAVIPILGLAGTFHYTEWMPPFISEWKWVSDGVQKFGNYFRRKGWLGDEEGSANKWSRRGEGGVRIVVEFAAAYAITKALMPIRLLFSVWATPWFARSFVIPFANLFKRLFTRRKAAAVPQSGAAGTGATGAGVIPKDVK